MQMTEVLDKLKSLQEILVQKYEIETKVAELPESLDGDIQSLNIFREQYIEHNKEYEEKKDVVRQLKLDLDEAQKRREDGEKGMDSITTHREYEALEKQINEAQKVEDEKRHELQKEEKNLAELNDTLKSEEDLISSTEKDVNDARENLDKEIAICNDQLNGLSVKENDVARGIDSETIIKFRRIIRRNKKGIVAVKGNVCDGCHMVLPAQFANEVRHGDKILFCPYCSRILFYEETGGEEDNYYSTVSSETASEEADEDLLEDDDPFDSASTDGEEAENQGKENEYEN